MDTLTDISDYHRESSGLMAEAVGWGRAVDQTDDVEVLAWARQYLPRMLAQADRFPR